MENFADVVEEFKRVSSSKMAENNEVNGLLYFLSFVLNRKGIIHGEILTDDLCYCGKYKMGDVMVCGCDGGCQYPGA